MALRGATTGIAAYRRWSGSRLSIAVQPRDSAHYRTPPAASSISSAYCTITGAADCEQPGGENGGHGFKLSPMIGVVMAELIKEGRATTVDISMLDLGRFKQGRPMRSRYGMRVLA
jgi:hypothetical protein